CSRPNQPISPCSSRWAVEGFHFPDFPGILTNDRWDRRLGTAISRPERIYQGCVPCPRTNGYVVFLRFLLTSGRVEDCHPRKSSSSLSQSKSSRSRQAKIVSILGTSRSYSLN